MAVVVTVASRRAGVSSRPGGVPRYFYVAANRAGTCVWLGRSVVEQESARSRNARGRVATGGGRVVRRPAVAGSVELRVRRICGQRRRICRARRCGQPLQPGQRTGTWRRIRIRHRCLRPGTGVDAGRRGHSIQSRPGRRYAETAAKRATGRRAVRIRFRRPVAILG